MAQSRRKTTSVNGTAVEVTSLGSGPPLLFLHGEDGLLFSEPFLEALAAHNEVIAPTHPGWAGSPLTAQFRSIDDIAYLYLDLLDGYESPVPVVGASFGGWLAMEMATKCCVGISALALLAPLGLRFAQDPTSRAFLDTYAAAPSVVEAALYGDPSRKPDLAEFDDDQMMVLAQAQEAFARFSWEPYLHNPCLGDRLHRITVPTLLVGGDRDGIILDDSYLKAIAQRITGPAEVITIPDIGHRVEEQAPADLAQRIAKFLSPAS